MNFEELQKSWRDQPVARPEDITVLRSRLTQQWRKQQRGAIWSNVGVTLGFATTLGVFAWVFITFHKGRSLLFSGSILFMAALLLVYLWVVWKGIAFKRTDLTTSTNAYVDNLVKKLEWRKKLITTYNRVYSILLWGALMLYMLDVTKGGSVLFRVGAPLATTAYIVGVQLVMKYTKHRKQLANINAMIEDMQKLKSAGDAA